MPLVKSGLAPGGTRGLLAMLTPAGWLHSSLLTDHKLHSKLILLGFVGAVEGDLDLELLSPTHDEKLGFVKGGAVLLLVRLFWL